MTSQCGLRFVMYIHNIIHILQVAMTIAIGAWVYITMVLHVPLYRIICVEQCLPFPYSSQGIGVHNCPTDLGIAYESCYIDNQCNIKTLTYIMTIYYYQLTTVHDNWAADLKLTGLYRSKF